MYSNIVNNHSLIKENKCPLITGEYLVRALAKIEKPGSLSDDDKALIYVFANIIGRKKPSFTTMEKAVSYWNKGIKTIADLKQQLKKEQDRTSDLFAEEEEESNNEDGAHPDGGGKGITHASKKRKQKSEHKKYTVSLKRPRSAVNYYVKDNFKAFAGDHPELDTMPAVNRELQKTWNTLPAQQKKKYEQMAAEDKERYMEEKRIQNKGQKTRKSLEPPSVSRKRITLQEADEDDPAADEDEDEPSTPIPDETQQLATPEVEESPQNLAEIDFQEERIKLVLQLQKKDEECEELRQQQNALIQEEKRLQERSAQQVWTCIHYLISC